MTPEVAEILVDGMSDAGGWIFLGLLINAWWRR